jgi:AcrR family transcriptional regulator
MPSEPPPATASLHGRKPVISRDDVIAAALTLLGPNRSVSSLSLREVAREAGIAPNSFYRQFRDMDELAVAIIERSGSSLRAIIGEARQRAQRQRSVVRGSVDAFMQQLRSDDPSLQILLREGTVGSDAFKQAVDRQLNFFEEELRLDLIRLADTHRTGLYEPALTAKAITRLVFAMGATAMDLPDEQLPTLSQHLVVMVRMILAGTESLAANPQQVLADLRPRRAEKTVTSSV